MNPGDFIQAVETPAWVYDESRILENLDAIRPLLADAGARQLFPLKCFTQVSTLEAMASRLDGWAASSPFEARLARSLCRDGQTVHATTPGLAAHEEEGFAEHCDFFACNSFGQFERMADRACAPGIRINPQRSYIEDERYDPCAPGSKLGIPLDTVTPEKLERVQGFLLHSNCESECFGDLLETVHHIEERVPGIIARMQWINLGGGYLFNRAKDLDRFGETLSFILERGQPKLFVEPGFSVVGDAGWIVSSVVDLLEHDGLRIAVLDTSVNHLPEVLEFDYEPPVLGAGEGAEEYRLAGCTCLAGDVFGSYCFPEPLQVGSRIVFQEAGAYSLVKAHTFNGVNLPTVYRLRAGKDLEPLRRFTYQDFLSKYRDQPA